MIGVLTALVVGVAVVAIFVTMGPGQRLVKQLGLRRLQKGAAPDEDRAYLLQACGGDRGEVERRLDALRERHPDFDESELYRRAIRAVMIEQGRWGRGAEGSIAASDGSPTRQGE